MGLSTDTHEIARWSGFPQASEYDLGVAEVIHKICLSLVPTAILSHCFAMSSKVLSALKTTQQLELEGFSKSTISRRLQTGHLTRVCRGIYLRPELARDFDETDHALTRIHAIALSGENRVISHESAALMWGAPLLKLPTKVHVSVAKTYNVSHQRILFHRNRPQVVEQARLIDGVLVASPLHVIIDCLASSSFLQALAITNHMLNKNLVTWAETTEALSQARGKGVRSARRILPVMSLHCESILESLALLRIGEWGLERPVQQWEVRTRSGALYRPDFAWPHLRLILEVDGRFKYTGRFGSGDDRVHKDVLRERELRNEGWTVVRATWSELMHSPETIRRVLLSHGVRPAA